MGRHRHKKVSDKDAEENITKQLVESGKKEELKSIVSRKSYLQQELVILRCIIAGTPRTIKIAEILTLICMYVC